jgi:hypothetical protein
VALTEGSRKSTSPLRERRRPVRRTVKEASREAVAVSGIEFTAPDADVRSMRLTLLAAFSIVAQIGAGQVRAQVWKLQDARRS